MFLQRYHNGIERVHNIVPVQLCHVHLALCGVLWCTTCVFWLSISGEHIHHQRCQCVLCRPCCQLYYYPVRLSSLQRTRGLQWRKEGWLNLSHLRYLNCERCIMCKYIETVTTSLTFSLYQHLVQCAVKG